MSVIDQALKANELYAKTYDPKWGAGPPKPKLAVVTCMDPRLSDLPGILGLKHADIDVIRTGGPAVTEDVLAELLVSTRVLGSKEIMLLNHTGCGLRADHCPGDAGNRAEHPRAVVHRRDQPSHERPADDASRKPHNLRARRRIRQHIPDVLTDGSDRQRYPR